MTLSLRALPALQRAAPAKLLSVLLVYRVLEIDGLVAKAKRQFLEELTMRGAGVLVNEFDRSPSRSWVYGVLQRDLPGCRKGARCIGST